MIFHECFPRYDNWVLSAIYKDFMGLMIVIQLYIHEIYPMVIEQFAIENTQIFIANVPFPNGDFL